MFRDLEFWRFGFGGLVLSFERFWGLGFQGARFGCGGLRVSGLVLASLGFWGLESWRPDLASWMRVGFFVYW